MNVPFAIPYAASWRFIALFAGIGVLMLALSSLFNGYIGVVASVGVAALFYSGLLGGRRLFFPRFLEGDEEAVSIPTGPFQMRIVKARYADLEMTFASPHGFDLRACGRTLTIAPVLLPDHASYIEVKKFVLQRMEAMRPSTPDQIVVGQEGVEYSFWCAYTGNGEVRNSGNEVVWRVDHDDTVKRSLLVRWLRPFRLPDFVATSPSGEEFVRVRRMSRLPRARFEMFKHGAPICTIRQRSFLLNRYTLDFADGSRWMFHMPLFTVFFKGASDAGGKIKVRLWTHNVWFVHLDEGSDNPHLVVALAFIHRERLRCV